MKRAQIVLQHAANFAYGLAMAAVAILILPVVVVLLMAGIFG